MASLLQSISALSGGRAAGKFVVDLRSALFDDAVDRAQIGMSTPSAWPCR
jgi:hypothetical protein